MSYRPALKSMVFFFFFDTHEKEAFVLKYVKKIVFLEKASSITQLLGNYLLNRNNSRGENLSLAMSVLNLSSLIQGTDHARETPLGLSPPSQRTISHMGRSLAMYMPLGDWYMQSM